MTRKGYKPGQIINKLREAELLLNQGATVGEASSKIGVMEQTLSLPETTARRNASVIFTDSNAHDSLVVRQMAC